MAEEVKGVTADDLDIGALEALLAGDKPEGESTPSGEPPAPKEGKGEGAVTPTPVKADEETVPLTRFKEVNEKAQRYAKYEGLIEILEKNPEAGRNLLGSRAEPERKEPAPEPAPQYTQEQVNAYWKNRAQEVGIEQAAAEIAAAKAEQIVQRAVEPVAQTSIRSSIRDFKSDMREDDEYFRRYEGIFDEIINQTDRRLLADPKYGPIALEKAADMARGQWVKEQRRKLKAAPAALPREKPPEPTVTAGTTPPVKATPKRKPTEEELEIARLYRTDVNEIIEEPEEASPWSPSGGR